MISLIEKQQIFAKLFSKLILSAEELGYRVTLAEVYRPDALAKLYASQGKGIAKSNHRIRLAADINLFKDGKYLTDSKDYENLGKVWEAMGADYGVVTCWGGRFKKPDGNHFSILHEGIK